MKHSHANPSKRYHDRVARRYDQMYDDLYWEYHDEITWRAIKPHLPRDLSAQCLDLGCGTGKWGLRVLKSGFATTFLDHSPAMIDQTRLKLESMGPRAKKAELLVGDIVDMRDLPADRFALTLAMGDPLSICTDPPQAAREMFRVCAPGGVVIATADNKLAALDHFLERKMLDELEQFVRTSRTHWLTDEAKEQFELHTFTPTTLRIMFEQAGFEVISLVGKTILPVRKNKELLEDPREMERLLRLEHDLSRDPFAAARASHLQ
ncbi:MAG: methyltransferase domain-containing protein, partial [Tepidisphaeraceae bacterium]